MAFTILILSIIQTYHWKMESPATQLVLVLIGAAILKTNKVAIRYIFHI